MEQKHQNTKQQETESKKPKAGTPRKITKRLIEIMIEDKKLTMEEGEIAIKHMEAKEHKDTNPSVKEQKQMEGLKPEIPAQGRPPEKGTTTTKQDAPNKKKKKLPQREQPLKLQELQKGRKFNQETKGQK